MSESTRQPPDALLLIAPGCAHCPLVLESLARLVKAGSLGRLEVINVAAHPEAAARAGSRSVPWTRIGPFVLEGLHGEAELREWVEHAAAGTGRAAYVADLLRNQQLDRALATVRQWPDVLPDLLALSGSLETPLAVRIGISAAVEDQQGSAALRDALPALAGLATSPEPAVRADAAHFLGLTGSAAARQPLEALLADVEPQVREIAAESLALLEASPSPQ